jgi:excinuclease ABC subunit B
MNECRKTIGMGWRVLVTVLTKKMAEQLSEYFEEFGIRAKYLHSEITTLDRVEIIKGFRAQEFDVLIGINLLREGLDIPECALVAILDADKEGFLRSKRSLIQTIGRAARNIDGRVILYADTITDSIKETIEETLDRRRRQDEFNKLHGITPKSISKAVIQRTETIDKKAAQFDIDELISGEITAENIQEKINALEGEMRVAAANLHFEKAAEVRDEMKILQRLLIDTG